MKIRALQAIAFMILAGFTILAVFGLAGVTSAEGNSILSCVAKSAGIISCMTGSDSFSVIHHEFSSFQALTSLVLAAVILALAVLVPILYIVPRTPSRVSYVFVPPCSSESTSTHRLRRWLSLFESSPGI